MTTINDNVLCTVQALDVNTVNGDIYIGGRHREAAFNTFESLSYDQAFIMKVNSALSLQWFTSFTYSSYSSGMLDLSVDYVNSNYIYALYYSTWGHGISQPNPGVIHLL